MVAAAAAGSDEVDWSQLIRRSYDAADINPILNRPEVFKTIACQGIEPGSLDVSELVADPRNVLLMSDAGGILAILQEPSIYEIHTNFIPAERGSQQGPHRMAVCHAAYRFMFTHTDCVTLFTRIPTHNRAAAVFAPMLGWTKEFERKAAWVTVEGETVDVGFYAMRYPEWVRKTLDLMKKGRWFHRRLDDEFKRHGRMQEQHPDEDCHDLYVGACVETMRGGQFEKAVVLYNRWARFAGYGLMGLVSMNPTVIDIGSALLQMTGDTFKVVKVRP